MDTNFEPEKHQKTESVKQYCVICGSEASPGQLSKPRDDDSWHALLKAAGIQKCDALLQHKSTKGIPDIMYHNECRKNLTHKKTLSRIYSESDTKESAGHEPRKMARRDMPSTSRVYTEVCIFCDRVNKYAKRSNTREKLCQSVDLRSDITVRKIAMQRMDQKMIAITSRELVAAEAHYHRSCYSNYTRDARESNDSKQECVEDTYTIKEREAYSMLFDLLYTDLFTNPRIVPITDLLKVLIANMNAVGVVDIKRCTKNHIRRKLEAEFGSCIQIIADTNSGKLFVIPDNLSKDMLVQENVKMAAELEAIRTDTDKLMNRCALEIRNDISSSSKEHEWPPQPEMLDNEYLQLPERLTQFLQTLLSGDSDQNARTEKVERLALSIAQDCVYAVSNGRLKSARHILLPWAVKTLTGNVELIKILNRLGHSISYTQLMEIDTALCMLKLTDVDDAEIALPSNIIPCVPTTLAFDNIDRIEETLSGAGTSHRVNGIIVQPDVPTVQQPKEMRYMTKGRRRTITPPLPTITPYVSGKRIGPHIVAEPVETNNREVMEAANTKNRVWTLVRQTDIEDQKISSWTGFNIQTRDNMHVTKDKVGYLPTVNAPATDMSTVNEILNQSLKIVDQLDLDEIVCVFDQALYAKAAEIVWKNEEKFNRIILRMGTFHTLCNIMSVIGKRFKDAGLRDIAVESGIIAEGSVDAVLEGRKYNRAIRLHKLVYEALLRLVWKGFYSWLEEEHLPEIHKLNETILIAGNIHSDVTEDNLIEVLNNSSCVRIFELFSVYLDVLRTDNGELSAFWMSYIDLVDLVLGLVRASREGNWHLHIAMIRAVIPWFFAYDRQNYAKYCSVYYKQMASLEDERPQAYTHLANGGFSVQLSGDNVFGRIPVDQTIEETVNKDTQTAGGTKGFSLKPGAVNRYYITAEYRSECLKQIREMIKTKARSGVTHADLTVRRIKRDEASVQLVVGLLENSWIDPFISRNQLVSISTATVAGPEVKRDMLCAQEKGEKAYNEFTKTRLEIGKPSETFYDRLPKLQLKTFRDIRKSRKAKVGGKEISLKADHKLFGHMVLVAMSRNLDMRQVLQHPLGPLPWALSNCDGTLKKTNKASLGRHLEKRVSPADEISSPNACVIDAMAIMHKINGDHKTFGELADTIFTSVLHCGSGSNRIDVVFDVYKDISVKSAERDRRSSDTGVVFSNIVAGQRIQQWRRLLDCSVSKTAMSNFLCDTWQSQPYRNRLGNKEMYITRHDQCYRLSKDEVCLVDELSTCQEEADTRMLLHSKHASTDHKAIVIVSEDTDVLILSLAFHNDIENMYIRCGTKNRLRHIDISKLGHTLGKDICKALHGYHAFTGCDSVSAFAGRGKVSGMSLILKEGKFRKAMSELGEQWSLSQDLFNVLQEFTCRLYSTRTNVTQVNDQRYQVFRAKKGDIESGQLPPCADSLFQHAKRANYQTGIWRKCLEQTPEIPSPDGHGWIVDDNQLIVDWVKGPLAPDAVIELMACKCSRKCTMPDCQCMANGLKCSPACKLQTCDNMDEEEDVSVDDTSDDEDDEEDDVDE